MATPEQPYNPELSAEQSPETPEVQQKLEQEQESVAEASAEEAAESGKISSAAATLTSIEQAEVEVIEVEKDAYHLRLEDILSDRLFSAWSGLSDGKRAKFKREGEELALFVRGQLDNEILDLNAIYEAISKWVEVSGVRNEGFIIQGSQMKTRAIMAMHEQLHETEDTLN